MAVASVTGPGCPWARAPWSHSFLMYHLEQKTPGWTTLRMAEALFREGHVERLSMGLE